MNTKSYDYNLKGLNMKKIVQSIVKFFRRVMGIKNKTEEKRQKKKISKKIVRAIGLTQAIKDVMVFAGEPVRVAYIFEHLPESFKTNRKPCRIKASINTILATNPMVNRVSIGLYSLRICDLAVDKTQEICAVV